MALYRMTTSAYLNGFFLAITLGLSHVANAAECTPQMLIANPFKMGSVNCTIPKSLDEKKSSEEPQKNAKEEEKAYQNWEIETHVGQSPESFERSVDSRKYFGFTHPQENELRRINKEISKVPQNLDAKLEYTKNLNGELQQKVSSSIMNDSIAHLAHEGMPVGSPEVTEKLLKFKSVFSPEDFNKLAVLNISYLTDLPNPNEREAHLQKLQELIRNLYPSSSSPKMNEQCQLIDEIVRTLISEENQGDETPEHRNTRLQLTAQLLSMQAEPRKPCAGDTAKFSKADIFNILIKRSILTGKESFVKQALASQPKRALNPSTDYYGCKINELQSAIGVAINQIRDGKSIHYVGTTSAKCSVQILGHNLKGKPVEIRIWNSSGERVLNIKQPFAQTADIENAIKGPYEKPLQGIIISTTAASSKPSFPAKMETAK